jgi:hypothetical protein
MPRSKRPALKDAPYWETLGPLSYLGSGSPLKVPPTAFGFYVKAQRINLSQLARDTGANRTYLSNAVWGRDRLSTPWARTIAAHLGEDPADLFPENRDLREEAWGRRLRDQRAFDADPVGFILAMDLSSPPLLRALFPSRGLESDGDEADQERVRADLLRFVLAQLKEKLAAAKAAVKAVVQAKRSAAQAANGEEGRDCHEGEEPELSEDQRRALFWAVFHRGIPPELSEADEDDTDEDDTE